MNETFTGTCPICYLPYGECRCRMATQAYINAIPPEQVTQRDEVEDLLHTIGMHCQIGRLIMEQKADYLLPSILEDISTFAQELFECSVKED